MKKILMINHFDKLPGEDFRDQRYTFLYNKLKAENQVTWLSSDFHHWSHKKRDIKKLPFDDKDNIVLIKTLTYKKNISLRRFISHSLVSIKTFMYLITAKKKYDVILTIAPVENLFLTTLYAKITKTSLIIDILDLWPDLFEQAFPKKVRFIGKICLFPFHLMANFAYKRAEHITSISKTYTNIGMSRANRSDIQNSSYFYLGAPPQNFLYNLNKSTNVLKCLFAGQFGHNYDIELILKVAKKCQENKINVEFYMAGNGFKFSYAENFITKNNLKNIHLLGWLDSSELLNIAKDCHVGLNSYKALATQSIPTKIFDYLGLGLFIINSLKGEVEELIKKDNLGVSYFSEDVQSLYDTIISLVENISKITEIGFNNKRIFDENYTFSVIYQDMANMITGDINA